MNHKRSLLLVLVAVFAIIGLCFIIAIFNSTYLSGILNTTPISYPLSYTSSASTNTITINQNQNVAFKYAVITSDDNLELLNEAGAKLIITLDQKEWKDIKWSPDGSLVSILGKDSANNYDIYIYDLVKQEFLKATSFDSFSSGVDTYVWTSSTDIEFMQGTSSDRWLTSYSYLSKNVVKVMQIDATIQWITKDEKYLLLNANNSLIIANPRGIVLADLSNLKDSNGEKLSVLEAALSQNADKVLVNTPNGLYKVGVSDLQTVKLDFSFQYSLICDLDEDHFLAAIFSSTPNSSIFEADDINVKELSEANLALDNPSNVSSFDFSRSDCNNDSIIFKANNVDNSTSWYTLKNAKLEEIVVLKNMNEVALTDSISQVNLNQ